MARKIALELGLEMKISDVEYQGDNTKATFITPPTAELTPRINKKTINHL